MSNSVVMFLPQPAQRGGQEAIGRPDGRPSAFWPALLMGVALVLCKVAMLASVRWWNAAGVWDRAGWLVISAHADVVFALAVGLAGQAVLWLVAGRPVVARRVWRGVVAACVICVIYGVASVILFGYLSTPLTYSLIYLAGDMKNMRSSAGAAISWWTIAGVVGVPVAYLLLVKLTASLSTQRTRSMRIVQGAGLLVLLLVVRRAEDQLRWVMPLQGELARNPHVVLASSCITELLGGRSIVLDHDYPPEYERDFSTIGDGIQPTPGLKRGPKNVIVIVCESLGTQHMALFGGKWPTTPNLQKESGHSLVFDGFYAHVTNTANALTAITLSTYVPMSWREVPVETPDIPGVTVPQILSQAGYRTAFISAGDNRWSNQERFLQGRGFQTIWDHRQAGRSSTWEFSWGVGDACMVDMLLGWIDDAPGRPFCAYTWTQGTHHPYYAGAGHRPIDFFAAGPPRSPDERDLDKYLNAMHELDAQLGRLFDALRKRGLADDTLIIITGDHGEAFGWPRKHYGHVGRIHEEDVHIPLIIWSPSLFRDEPRRNTVGAQVDLNPTIMDLLGLPADPGWQGRSLFAPTRANRAYVFGCSGLYYLGMRQGNWKYIHDATHGREELYDLSADPMELKNLTAENPALCRELRGRVAAWVGAQQKRGR